MSRQSPRARDEAIYRFLDSLEHVKKVLCACKVCLVYPADRPPIVEDERLSFLSALPEMGLEVDELCYRDVHDFFADEAIRRLSGADLVVKLVHGPENRAGLVQAVLQALDIPTVGHALETDLLSQRKSVVKELMILRGIPTLPYSLVRGGRDAPSQLASVFQRGAGKGYVLKPDDTNASKGLRYLIDERECERAALEGSGCYVVEPYVRGRVLTVGVATIGREVHPIPPLEYLLADNELIMDESWKLSPKRALATEIAHVTRDAIMGYAVELHRAVRATGLSRSDFILTSAGDVFALEINTNIGLSRHHDIAVAFRENGLNYKDLLWAHLGSIGGGASRRGSSPDSIFNRHSVKLTERSRTRVEKSHLISSPT